MSGFEALGRDVAAAADSEGDQAVATSIKALWVWAGFDAGTNPNHLWEVAYEKTEDGFTVAAQLLDKDVWAPEPVVSPPASAAELERSGAEASPVDEVSTPEVVPEPEASEVAAEDVPAPEADPEVVPEPAPEVADESAEKPGDAEDETPDAAAQ